MEKRGQITFFLIIAVAIIIIFGLAYYISSFSAKKKTAQVTKEKLESNRADVVKAYVESCLKMVSEDALFNRVGLQGGYIDPNGDASYKENGVPNPPPTSFLGKAVPYYLEATCIDSNCNFNENLPSLSAITEKLANYATVEFEKCFNANIFEDINIIVAKPLANPKIGVSLNEEDVSIKLEYPLIAKIDGNEAKLDSFAVTLPIRLNALYSSSADFMQKIKNKGMGAYTITTEDCKSFDKNGLTNLYIKNNEIVQLVDFSTYEKNYFNSYVFQFAVKNVKIDGDCAG